MNKARVVKTVWKLLVGGAATGFGLEKLVSFLGQTAITVEALLWIAVVAVGISVLGSALD